jgi:hypothetical protein
MPSRPDLASLYRSLREATPLRSNARSGRTQRPGGYTLDAGAVSSVHYPPGTFYASAGNLHLTPGYINGLAPTVRGTPLDAWPPPPIMSIEDLERMRHWFLLQITFGEPRIETLGWPEYSDGDFSEPSGYTNFQAIVPGTPTIALELLVFTDNPYPAGDFSEFPEVAPLTFWYPTMTSGSSVPELNTGLWAGRLRFYSTIELQGKSAPGESPPTDWVIPTLTGN